MNKHLRWTPVVPFVVFSFGCATLFRSSTDRVNFSSDPAGAKVYVNGQLMGTTPVELRLEAKRGYTIEFRKEGYENRTVVINTSVGAGWVILDILGGLIPVVIDAATGKWHGLDEDNVRASLEAVRTAREEKAPPPATPGVTSPSPPPPEPPRGPDSEPSQTGCTKDTDCKGTRICVSGTCVEPAR